MLWYRSLYNTLAGPSYTCIHSVHIRLYCAIAELTGFANCRCRIISPLSGSSSGSCVSVLQTQLRDVIYFVHLALILNTMRSYDGLHHSHLSSSLRILLWQGGAPVHPQPFQ